MKPQDYITSGLLELYVYGVLDDHDNEQISNLIDKYPEIRVEVEDIELILMELSTEVSPSASPQLKSSVLKAIGSTEVDEAPKTSRSLSVFGVIGWAASLLLLGGILWLFNLNSNLETEVQVSNANLNTLEEQLNQKERVIADYESTLEVLRDKDVTAYSLPGNEPVAPDAYAKAFLDKKNNKVYLDLAGLPKPPKGMVYQVWSLKLDPLTPTSIAVLDQFNSDQDKIFEISNLPETEAFGVTLEPEGGSKSPTLEQLYVLGTV